MPGLALLTRSSASVSREIDHEIITDRDPHCGRCRHVDRAGHPPAAPDGGAGEIDPRAGAVQAGNDEVFGSLAELQASYARKLADLDRKKLADLAALAQRQSGIEAEAAYRMAFDLAVSRGLYTAAEPIARAYLAREHGEPESHALAASIILISRAERGEFEQSLADLKGFLKRRAASQGCRRAPAFGSAGLRRR